MSTTKWFNNKTEALKNIDKGLKVVDGILYFVEDRQGKPSKEERALFAAAVVFIYGVWENYVEQLAIELVEHLSESVEPQSVPDRVQKALRKKDAWELTVSPGWRALWIKQVEKAAIGDDETYGLNTAKSGQVRNLLNICGVNDPFDTLDLVDIPSHVQDEIDDPCKAIDKLVELRGEIVHTGTVPSTLRKNHVTGWRESIEAIVETVDKHCRSECKKYID